MAAAAQDDGIRLVTDGQMHPRSRIPFALFIVRGPAAALVPLACSARAAHSLPSPPLAPCRPHPTRPSLALLQEDIALHLEAHKTGVESVLAALQNLHSKYKFMESNLVENRKQLLARHPELLANLDAVRMLMGMSEAGGGSGQPFSTYFALADQVHAKATVAPSGRVCLWLGADVMLEYSYAEALELLQANSAAAEKKLAETEEDCDFVREQIITIEVRGQEQRELLLLLLPPPRRASPSLISPTATPPLRLRRLTWRGSLTTTWRCSGGTRRRRSGQNK
jgi:prefoldin subunit 5